MKAGHRGGAWFFCETTDSVHGIDPDLCNSENLWLFGMTMGPDNRRDSYSLIEMTHHTANRLLLILLTVALVACTPAPPPTPTITPLPTASATLVARSRRQLLPLRLHSLRFRQPRLPSHTRLLPQAPRRRSMSPALSRSHVPRLRGARWSDWTWSRTSLR